MCVLSDVDLQKLYPQMKTSPGPASIDLHLGSSLLYWPDWVKRNPRIDQRKVWKPVGIVGESWTLKPGIRYLAATRERLVIPVNLAGQIAARSSFGRDGLAVIQGPAGWIDPGFSGNVVLELSVIGSDLELWPGAAVAQLILMTLTSPSQHPYSGKYQDQSGPVASRYYREHKEADDV